MTSNAARISAIISAILTLLCVGFWLVNGAPNVPHMNLLIGETADAHWRAADISVTWLMIWGLASVTPVGAHAVLFIFAATTSTAAFLCLLMLLRGGSSPSIRILGAGLGWWSLCICYQGLFSIIPLFSLFSLFPIALRVACDVLSFQLLLIASHAFVRFWKEFPTPVTDEELAVFIGTMNQKRSELTSPFQRRLNALVRDRFTVAWDKTRQILFAGDRAFSMSSRFRRLLILGAIIFVVLGESLFWRGYAYIPDDGVLGPLYACLGVFVSLGCILVFGSLVLKALRLFKYHRSVGSAEDRRKVEWISAALWLAVILFLLPAAVTPLLYLGEHWYPELAFERGWIGIYLLLALMSAPLIVLVALALSIFYRGSVDPRLALRGITVWTLLGIVLTLAFVFVERSIAQRVVAWLGLPPQTSMVSAGAIVAATFQPLRKESEKYVNSFVERVLPATMLASGIRRVAAVAVVDISGYTSLSERDEQSALLASALVQKQSRRLADKHGGRVVKSTGDGVIMIYASAQQSFEAIRELHTAVTTGAVALNLSGLQLHSALHWGEIVEMHDGDIYGQTVNITARIADWAKAGEIGASQIFGEQLRTGTQGFEVIGPQTFKNVQQSISCMKLVTG